MREIQDVTGNLWDISILYYLDCVRKEYSNIRETAYLKDFAALETFDNTINPKIVIRDTLLIYLRNVYNIYKQPGLLQECTFKFSLNNKKHCFEYSNNMMFSDDIVIMCFLFCIQRHKEKRESKTAQILMSLMKNKYGIYIEKKLKQKDNTESTQEQNRISLYDIIFSYPSISQDIITDTRSNDNVSKTFNDFDLPKILLLDAIIPVLPKLNQAPPLAILLLIALKRLKQIQGSNTAAKTPLFRTFAKIYILLMRPIFPKRLKLELCEKWQIIIRKETRYEYAPYFAAYRQKAKDMIAEMKPNDPGLKSLLSQL